MPLLRLVFLVAPTTAPIDVRLLLLTLFRGVIIAFLGIWFTRLADLERELERRVKVLEGMLAICAFCKKIRNEHGDWEQLEGFISRKSEAQFSHGVCPACSETHYPGMMDEVDRTQVKATYYQKQRAGRTETAYVNGATKVAPSQIRPTEDRPHIRAAGVLPQFSQL